MLDAFKTMTGGKGKLVQEQSDELGMLITTAREERSALSAMLTALTARSAKLAPLGKTLEQVSEKATTVTTRLDEIGNRLTALDDRTKQLEEVERRIQALKESARQAEQTTQKALGPDGELCSTCHRRPSARRPPSTRSRRSARRSKSCGASCRRRKGK